MQLLRRHSRSVVLDLQMNIAIGSNQTNISGRTSRMAVNIGEALLHRSEDRRFHVLREPPEVFGDIQINPYFAALGESFDVPANRRGQPGFVQQGRMEEVRNRADFLVDFLGQRQGVVNGLSGLLQTFQIAADRAEIHGQRRQSLPDAVMQFAGQPPSLIVLRAHQRTEATEMWLPMGQSQFRILHFLMER